MENWDDYRYFLAVAETGSVSAAARRLDTTQPTVGRRITELERRLGSTLFLRGPGGYRLTELGAQVRDRVRSIEADSLWIEEKLRFAANDRSGRVTLTTAESLDRFVVAHLLADFNHQYPEIELDLMITYDAMDLLASKADIALRVGEPGSGEYVGRRLATVHFGLYAGKTYLARNGAPANLGEIPNHIVIESVRRIRNLPQCRLLREHAGDARRVMSADSVAVQIEGAESGLGLVALPVYAAVENEALVRVLPGEFDLARDLWLLTHRDLRKNPRIRAVLDFLGREVVARLRRLESPPRKKPNRPLRSGVAPRG